MAEQNPYHPHLPPDDPTLFYGRQDAAAFLRQRLVGAHNRNIILILGRLGMGKTALLHHVDYIVDERYATVYLNVAEINLQSGSAFILSMVTAIVARMEIIGASTYRVPSPPDSADEMTLRRWFVDDFLDVVLTAIRRDRFLLVMLDDFQAMLNAIDMGTLPPDFMEYLGSLLDQHERLDILAAIDVDDENRLMRYPLTSNVHFHYRLQHLDPEAARQLITEPVTGAIQYSEDAVQRILALCGGYPFLLHSICRLLYRLWESSPQIITAATLDYIYTPALEETGEILRDWWGKTTPNMQAAIRALLDFPQQPVSQDSLRQWLTKSRTRLNETQLFSTLRALEYSTLVKATEDGSYFFSTGLEADWLRVNLQELEAQHRASRLPNRTHIMGILGVLATLLLIGILLASGILRGSDETEPLKDAPPTSTFGLDINATRQAEAEQATLQAIPSNTITTSLPLSDTPTQQPTQTSRPTRTPRPTQAN
jgi:energy-coupling factor transporter ATP-binding protein EcfA2